MKKIYLLIAAIAVVVFAVEGAWKWNNPHHANAGPPTQPVMRRDINSSILATGTIRPKVGAEVKVGSRVSGVLQKLYFNIGDVVRRGNVIAKLDDRELRARLAQARADLSSAEARLTAIKRGAREQEIQQAEAALQEAKADIQLAGEQYKRQLVLRREGLIPQDVLDIARRNFDTARAKREAAQERLALVREKFLPEDIRAAEAQVEQARAKVQLAETQLSYATIIAPISGVIASVATQEGEAVAAGFSAPTFVVILDLENLQLDSFVDETDIGKVQIGQEVTFTVDAYPGREFKGEVIAVYPKAVIQQNVVYYDTIVDIQDTLGLLRPEMTANVTILLSQRKPVLAVPNQAIKREQGRKVVYVWENGAAVRRVIRTGWKDGSYSEILSGLKEGERVVVGKPPSE